MSKYKLIILNKNELPDKSRNTSKHNNLSNDNIKIKIRMYTDMKIPGELSLLSLTPFLLQRVRAAAVSQPFNVRGGIFRGGGWWQRGSVDGPPFPHRCVCYCVVVVLLCCCCRRRYVCCWRVLLSCIVFCCVPLLLIVLLC